MPKTGMVYVSRHFRERDYLHRLRLMREILGLNQIEFAEQLGVPHKRWTNYERGYPIPRQVAWILWDRYGVSVEWLWYGATGNLTNGFIERLKVAEVTDRERLAAERQMDRAKARLKEVKDKQRKALNKHRKRHSSAEDNNRNI